MVRTESAVQGMVNGFAVLLDGNPFGFDPSITFFWTVMSIIAVALVLLPCGIYLTERRRSAFYQEALTRSTEREQERRRRKNMQEQRRY